MQQITDVCHCSSYWPVKRPQLLAVRHPCIPALPESSAANVTGCNADGSAQHMATAASANTWKIHKKQHSQKLPKTQSCITTAAVLWLKVVAVCLAALGYTPAVHCSTGKQQKHVLSADCVLMLFQHRTRHTSHCTVTLSSPMDASPKHGSTQ